MKTFLSSWLSPTSALLVLVLAVSGLANAATQYVVANDDYAGPFSSGVTFFTVAPNGLLTLKQQVVTGGNGIGGGFFGANRIRVLNGSQGCVYSSDAATGDIAGIVVSTLTIGGIATGSVDDGGTSNGIGLALNDQYLYASFTDSNTIGTFQVQPGCGLSFLNDT